MNRRTVAAVLSEIFGPAPLLVLAYLVVGFRSSDLPLAAVVVTCLAVIPYALTAVLARRGRVTDRFVRDRAQRVPVLVGTLVFVLLGLTILLLTPGNHSQLILMTVVVITALVVTTGISLKWKMSIHATIAAFSMGILVVVVGWIVVPIAAVVCAATCWARFALAQHSIGQLFAGVVLGSAMASVFALLV